MKIKCNDYLPKDEDFYDTDLGILLLQKPFYKLVLWYSVKITKYMTTYSPKQPLWWDQKD